MAKNILIIEDDNFLQGLEAKKLKKEGYEVFAASNSDEAFEVINKNVQLDLILLDILLPGMDGFGILERVRKNETIKNIPVIVFSNLSEEKDIKHAKELGVNDFMVKSNFTLDELAEKVKELIG